MARDQPAGFTAVRGGEQPIVVGADVGFGPVAWTLIDGTWELLPTDGEGDLWWVALESDWLAGEGRLLDFSQDPPERVELPGTLFGVSDTLAVGTDGVWLHEGESWRALEKPVESSLWKTWGEHVVGADGRILRLQGDELVVEPSGLEGQPLFTVHGDGERTMAVGGATSGLVLERRSESWELTEIEGSRPLTGVFVRASCAAVAVGPGGGVWEQRPSGEWGPHPLGAPTVLDLHAVYLDEDCGIWAAGGALTQDPMTHGVVAYLGDRDLPELRDERERSDTGVVATSMWRERVHTCAEGVRSQEAEVLGRWGGATIELLGDVPESAELVPIDWHPQFYWTRVGGAWTSDVGCEAEETALSFKLTLLDLAGDPQDCAVWGPLSELHPECDRWW